MKIKQFDDFSLEELKIIYDYFKYCVEDIEDYSELGIVEKSIISKKSFLKMKEKIAILGSAKFGNKVISKLEKEGGINQYKLIGSDVDKLYFITNNNIISYVAADNYFLIKDRYKIIKYD